MIFTYEYDRSYKGPALPIVEITIYQAGNRTNGLVISYVLIDSGADGCMFPPGLSHKKRE